MRLRQIWRMAWDLEESLLVPFWEVTLAAMPKEMYYMRSLLLAILVSDRPTMLTLFLESSLR